MSTDRRPVTVTDPAAGPAPLPLPGMPAAPAPAEPLSADRRRTLRQRAQVATGTHPLALTRTRPDLGTCGDCAHRVLMDWHNRAWPKCDVDPSRLTHGAGTDVRAWWPACTSHVPAGPPPLLDTPDAARWVLDDQEDASA